MLKQKNNQLKKTSTFKEMFVRAKPRRVLNESQQITLKTREITMISSRSQRYFAHTCFNPGGFIKGSNFNRPSSFPGEST